MVDGGLLGAFVKHVAFDLSATKISKEEVAGRSCAAMAVQVTYNRIVVEVVVTLHDLGGAVELDPDSSHVLNDLLILRG